MAVLRSFTRFVYYDIFKLQASRFTTLGSKKREDLKDEYNRKKAEVEADELSHSIVEPEAIFANNELNLGDIDVYGFDYDYTLAAYRTELHDCIYHLGQHTLIESYKYPADLLNFKYDPDFAIRGLHCDIKKGLLMKLDSFHNIQLGTVYRGLKPVSDREVKSIYNGTHVSLENMNTFYGQGPMHQLIDLFALPEVSLIANITEYLVQNNINYDAEYIFYDVRNAIQGIHSSGVLHQKIMENLDIFLMKCDKTKYLLERLRLSGKKIFLITNSGFPFVDAGLKYMIGDDWRDMFDVVVTNARKPKFFNETSRSFGDLCPLFFVLPSIEDKTGSAFPMSLVAMMLGGIPPIFELEENDINILKRKQLFYS